MKKSSPKKVKRKENLPPHSWESHPLAKGGETSKTFVVMVISIILIIVLVLFLFIGQQLVGKAYTPGVVNTAGLEDVRAEVNTPFSATVKANIGASSSSVGLSFELDLTRSGLTCADVNGIESLLGWNVDELVLSTADCVDNKIIFEYATMDGDGDTAKTGSFDVARINFNAIATQGTYNLDFTSFNIIDLNSNDEADLISDDGADATITVAPAPACSTNNDCTGENKFCNRGTCVNNLICTDSDNGINLFTRGQTEGLNGMHPTYRGITEASDSCSSDYQVIEYLCRDNLIVVNDRSGTFCPGNARCVEGRCVDITEMTLTSLDFNNGEVLREEFTCGTNRNINGVSPRLTVHNIPASANSLALIVEDLDIERTPQIPLVHWVVYDIPIPTTTTSTTTTPTRMTTLEIPRGVVFSSAASVVAPALKGTLGKNEITSTSNQYAPPCPPVGTTHRYRFRVYALTTSSMNPGILTDNFIRSNEFADTVSQASLTGIYYPPPAPSAEVPNSGGGGSRCRSEWSCPSTWNYCNATLEQSRTCTDLNRCDSRKLTKLENRSCTACEESWVCTPWSSCQNGQQTRNCADEHSCGAVLQKPALQKSCQQIVEPGPAPVRVQPQLPPPPIQQPAPLPVPSFWEQYKWFITGIPAAVLVIILIIFGVMHAFKPKAKPVAAATEYKVEELKGWVQKEKQAGTSNNDIKTMLAQHTGWSSEEIESKFTELKLAGSSSETPNSPQGQKKI